MSFNILHLSDVHIGKGDVSFIPLSALLIQAIKEKREIIHQVVVTGDIFDGCATYKTDEAVAFFNNLLTNINNHQDTPITRHDFLFVPGNHEIERGVIENKGKLEDAFTLYQKFLKKFYETDRLPDFFIEESLAIYKTIESKKIIFIGINSAYYDQDKSDFGYFNQLHFSKIQDNLLLIDETNYKIVLMLHHHFYQFQEASKETIDQSSLRNPDAFLSSFEEFNVKAILHGHKHENIIRRININCDQHKQDRIVTVIASGSINKEDLPVKNFNIVKICNDNVDYDLDVITFERHGQNRFKSISEISFPVQETYMHKSNLESILKQDGDLYEIYEKISSKGAPTYNYHELLNKTIGQSLQSHHILVKNKKALLLMLLVAHHRLSENIASTIFDEIKSEISSVVDAKTKEYFLKLLSQKNIYTINEKELHLNIFKTKTERECVIFSLIGFFIADFYLTLTNKADSFFEIAIKGKTNFNVSNSNEVISGINTNKILIEFDEDKRAVSIDVRCTKAISHKVAKLIINEYEILLANFEKLFSEVGFKLYYLSSKISSSNSDNPTLQSYTFTAYMKTLLNLLAGQHIYRSQLVFIRELIQNSIDAITLRSRIDSSFNAEKGKVEITLNRKNDSILLKLKDNGVGMTKYHIERYLTTVGRSFYKSEEFDNLTKENKYQPISQFGIGFLSSFNISDTIKVTTKYFDDSLEPLGNYLEIPNIDGCFFINDCTTDGVGTTIDLEIKKIEIIENDSLLKYVKKTFVNCKYDIYIDESLAVKAYGLDSYLAEMTKKYGLNFKIPLDENGNLLQENTHSPYGIYLYKPDNALFGSQEETSLANGIKVEKSDLPEEFSELQKGFFYIMVNLPSNLLELEVSRDKVKQYKLQVSDDIKNYLELLIKNYLETECCKDLPMAVLHQINSSFTNMIKSTIQYNRAKKSLIATVNEEINLTTIVHMLNLTLGSDIKNCRSTKSFLELIKEKQEALLELHKKIYKDYENSMNLQHEVDLDIDTVLSFSRMIYEDFRFTNENSKLRIMYPWATNSKEPCNSFDLFIYTTLNTNWIIDRLFNWDRKNEAMPNSSKAGEMYKNMVKSINKLNCDSPLRSLYIYSFMVNCLFLFAKETKYNPDKVLDYFKVMITYLFSLYSLRELESCKIIYNSKIVDEAKNLLEQYIAKKKDG